MKEYNGAAVFACLIILAFVLITPVLALSASAPIAAPFRHVYSKQECGNAIGIVRWSGLKETQQFQRCTMRAVIDIRLKNPHPTPTKTPTETVTPTRTPLPTNTPFPTPTSTPTPWPTATPVPFPTVVPAACGGRACDQQVIALVNQIRAQYGRPPLQFDQDQSSGTEACVGSQGHSDAMAQTGSIWHVNQAFPQASFPADICGGSFSTAGENVGYASNWQSDWNAIQLIINDMMSEQHDDAYCAQYSNHACSILSRSFSRTGVGITDAGGALYLTEDFSG